MSGSTSSTPPEETAPKLMHELATELALEQPNNDTGWAAMVEATVRLSNVKRLLYSALWEASKEDRFGRQFLRDMIFDA